MELAAEISGLTVNGTIESPEDQDWFVLVGQEGYNPTFTIAHDDENDFDFEIFNGAESLGGALGSESGDSITCRVPGRCHLRVWSCKGNGDYSIAITLQGKSESTDSHGREPNDTKDLANAVSGMVIEGEITYSEEGDVDWFMLEDSQEGYHPTFTITHNDDCDFDFEIYSGEECVGRALGDNNGDSIQCDVPGRCFLKVWGSKGSGRYSIQIAIEDSETDEIEPNDNRNLADSVSDMAISGKIANADDVDWFVLEGQEGLEPTFTITHGNASDFDFEIYSDGESVGRATGISSGDSLRCDVPGRCFVRVWSCNGIGTYRIVIEE